LRIPRNPLCLIGIGIARETALGKRIRAGTGRFRSPVRGAGTPALDLGPARAYITGNPQDIPEPPLATPRFEEIAEDFALLDDWEDRYRYVIDLGNAMPPLEDALKVSATKVEGCASQVWLVPDIAGAGPSAHFDFRGDSDAMIVRGLIAVLRALYGGLSPAAVIDTDAQAQLARLGLDQHLSSQRSNGLRAMVGRLRAAAQSTLQQA
jgi:cysteine desulfuration protein SufE